MATVDFLRDTAGKLRALGFLHWEYWVLLADCGTTARALSQRSPASVLSLISLYALDAAREQVLPCAGLGSKLFKTTWKLEAGRGQDEKMKKGDMATSQVVSQPCTLWSVI